MRMLVIFLSKDFSANNYPGLNYFSYAKYGSSLQVIMLFSMQIFAEHILTIFLKRI